MFLDVYQKRTSTDFYVELSIPNSTVRTFHCILDPVTEDGSFLGISATFILQKESKVDIESWLLDQVEQAIICTDNRGLVTYWNRSAEKLYGWSKSEVIGQLITSVTPSSSTKEMSEYILNSMIRGASWQVILCGANYFS